MRAPVKGVRGEPMSRHTSWRIGGPADIFLSVATTDDVIEAVLASREQGLPVFMLGGGTNILVSDRGVRGVVVENNVNDVPLDGAPVPPTAGVPLAHRA